MRFMQSDLADKLNILERHYFSLKTKYFYKIILKKCGQRNNIKTPVYWNPNFIEISSNCSIGYHCRLEAVRSWGEKKYQPSLVIGDNVSMEQSCHITFAGDMNIANGTTISYGVMIMDIDHNYQDIEVDIIKQNILVKPTEVGENCFIGAGAKIQAGTKLGRQCIVGANAVIRGDFPDYCVIVGIPGKVIKRYNKDSERWEKTDKDGEFLNEI